MDPDPKGDTMSTNKEKLTNDALDILAQENGETSLSHMKTCLRDKWKVPSKRERFEGLMEDLGFTVETRYTKTGNARKIITL